MKGWVFSTVGLCSTLKQRVAEGSLRMMACRREAMEMAVGFESLGLKLLVSAEMETAEKEDDQGVSSLL